MIQSGIHKVALCYYADICGSLKDCVDSLNGCSRMFLYDVIFDCAEHLAGNTACISLKPADLLIAGLLMTSCPVSE